MIGDRSKFTSLKKKKKELVTFSNNANNKILGTSNIGSFPMIKNVLLVDGLKSNLLYTS